MSRSTDNVFSTASWGRPEPIASHGSKAAFTCALEAFGADHLVTGSDYPVLQDYEAYKETFAYIERLGLPKSDTDKILHHNAQALFGFAH
jgi:predicted TIM-barrel fold metal-dependent hydrolase